MSEGDCAVPVAFRCGQHGQIKTGPLDATVPRLRCPLPCLVRIFCQTCVGKVMAELPNDLVIDIDRRQTICRAVIRQPREAEALAKAE